MKQNVKFRIIAEFETEIDTENYISNNIDGCVKEAIKQYESLDDVLFFELEKAKIKVTANPQKSL